MAGSSHRDDLEQPRTIHTRTHPRRLQPRAITLSVRGSTSTLYPTQLYYPIISFINIFLLKEQPLPASLLLLLLLKAGVEQNPGPTQTLWFCSVCKNRILGNTTSVQCNTCKNWCHMRRCTNLDSHRDWSSTFVGACCVQTVHTSHIQASQTNTAKALKILQHNCDGLGGKIDQIIHYMTQRTIDIAAIQETKLTNKSQFSAAQGNYTVLRQDRKRSEGGGLAFIIHNTIQFKSMKLPNPTQYDEHLEQQAITITSGTTDINLVNVYIPPVSSCSTTPGYRTNINHLLDLEDSIIMGDFNAHNTLWDKRIEPDQRGDDLVVQIDASHFGVLNDEDTHTRMRSGILSSPDITLASTSLLPSIEWETEIGLNSDHLPIRLSIDRIIKKVESEKRTYINFIKADWDSFRSFTDSAFENIQPFADGDVIKGEKVFRKIMNEARRRHIPTGRIPTIIPNFPTEAAKIVDRRDQLRAVNHEDPAIKNLNKEINQMVYEHKKAKWHEHLKEANFYKGPKNLWKTIKGLLNPCKLQANNAINFDKPTLDPKKCATNFNRQFTTHPGKQRNRGYIKRKFQNYASNNKAEHDEIEFTSNNVWDALKKIKSSKALGPDEISPIMLKHLGEHGVAFLTRIINLSLHTLTIPYAWKTARIIPILKPGKDADSAKSFRPISLLSPIAKLIETLLLPLMTDNITLKPHQHGFRKGHSTNSALHTISDVISRGLNQRQPCARTILVALDLSRAFDTVSISQLQEDILDTTIPWIIKRWLHSYLNGRQTYVEFRNATSSYRRMKQGVPQGGVISPTLFNLYMSKMPTPPANITLVSYADDCSLLISGNNLEDMTDNMNEYLNTLHNWLCERKLILSAEKSTATLFTTWTQEVSTILKIEINREILPTTKNPKILGVTLDPMMTYNKHAEITINKLKTRNNMFKTLAGTNWGKDKETMITAYKSIARPILNYAAPIWTPQLSHTNWSKLQVCQNSALRTITGCHLMSGIDHLHSETEILPAKTHNQMLSEQYLLTCQLPQHPCNNLVRQEPPPRCIRHTAQSSYMCNIQHLVTQPPDTSQLKSSLKYIHTKTVTDTIARFKPNRVLGTHPPPVSLEERHLPRETRSKLAQLRSGFSKILNSYISRIDPATPDECPLCNGSPHDTSHLFSCPSNPTTLTPVDLWTRPARVAEFLSLPTGQEYGEEC